MTYANTDCFPLLDLSCNTDVTNGCTLPARRKDVVNQCLELKWMALRCLSRKTAKPAGLILTFTDRPAVIATIAWTMAFGCTKLHISKTKSYAMTTAAKQNYAVSICDNRLQLQLSRKTTLCLYALTTTAAKQIQAGPLCSQPPQSESHRISAAKQTDQGPLCSNSKCTELQLNKPTQLRHNHNCAYSVIITTDAKHNQVGLSKSH